MLPYEVGSTSVQAVDDELRSLEVFAKLIKENLQEAQVKIKYFADRKRRTLDLEVGEMVYLRLRPYQKLTVSMRRSLKIAPRYNDPSRTFVRLNM